MPKVANFGVRHFFAKTVARRKLRKFFSKFRPFGRIAGKKGLRFDFDVFRGKKLLCKVVFGGKFAQIRPNVWGQK